MLFEHFHIPRILFGPGQFNRIGDLAAQLGHRILIISNARDDTNAALAAHLAASKLHTILLPQKGEPTVADIEQALDAARGTNADTIIGLGGGSAIDAAKAVAGLLANGGGPLDYMEVIGQGKKLTKPATPWIAIPCTAGTGAEATRNAVIGYPEKNFKASLRSEHLLATIALIDPELSLNVRPEITARSGMDALCQCIEAYTSTGATPMTDPLALEGIRRAARSLKIAYTDGKNAKAREDMALAALYSGIALTNAGLGAVHGFAAPLGASFPIPHGTICAALLPPVIATNAAALQQQKHPVFTRYVTVGKLLANREDLDDTNAIRAALYHTSSLVQDLQIPRLATYGLKQSDIPSIVALAKKSSSMRYNPVPLPDDTLTQILASAL